jgi:hypothetical protein
VYIPVITEVEEAMRYVKAQKLKEKRREEDEKKLFGDSDNSGDVVDVDNDKEEGGAKSVNNENGEKKKAAVKEDVEMESAEDIVEDTRWDWTDSGQVGEFVSYEYLRSLLQSLLGLVLTSPSLFPHLSSLSSSPKNQHSRCRCPLVGEGG